MATAKIEAAIAKIPEKKESLRKALEALRSNLASSYSFPFSVPEWNDLDAHLSSVEASIRSLFETLKTKEAAKPPSATGPSTSPATATTPVQPPSSFLPSSKKTTSSEQNNAVDAETEAVPRPELGSLCVNMDGRGLVSFISQNRRNLPFIRNELTAAIRSAPDPAKLVLDTLEAFFSSTRPAPTKGSKDFEAEATRRICISLVERIQAIGSEVRPSVREKARKLAIEWKEKEIIGGRDNGLEVIGLLQLIRSYGLVSEFKLDELLDLLVLISRRKQVVDLCNRLGLAKYVPDLIERLSSKGRQLDAVRFVYAFNLLERYPPVPLLQAYIKEAEKAAQDARDKGNNSAESENVAAAKELGALKTVLKAVEEHNLETEYPREILDKQIAKLEKRKGFIKRNATAAAPSKSKVHKHQPPKKRPWPSSAKPTITDVQNTKGPSLLEQSPHMDTASAYGFVAKNASISIYQSPPRSYYSVHPRTGLPPSYSSSFHRT